MYATGGESPYRAACRRLLRDITEERLHVVIDAEIIQEILYRYSALRRWETGLTMAASLLQIVPKVLPVRREDMEQMPPDGRNPSRTTRCAARTWNKCSCWDSNTTSTASSPAI